MTAWTSRFPGNTAIADITRDLSIIIQFFQHQSDIDPSFYQPSDTSGVWLVPIIQRCLELIPNGSVEAHKHEFEMQEILRHAILLFVQPIRRKFGIFTGSSIGRLCKLKALLDQHQDDWDGLESLLCWVLASAYFESTLVADQEWFVEFMAASLYFRNVRGDEIIAVLRSLIWIDDVFQGLAVSFTEQIAKIRADQSKRQPKCNGKM